MKKLKKITFIIFILLTLCSVFSSCYASSAITKENLNIALQKIASLEENDKGYTVTLNENFITVIEDGKSYNFNYNLSNKPVFTYEVEIQKGMSYEVFEEKTDNLFLPILGYIAVANIQGAGIKEAGLYMLQNYFISSLTSPNDNPYVIVGNLEEVSSDDSEIILKNEFGEKVIEYVNTVYKNKQVITDNTVNSFEWVIERKDVTENSCKLVSTLSVNIDSDFSFLEQNEKENNNENSNSDGTSIQESSNLNEEENNQQNSQIEQEVEVKQESDVEEKILEQPKKVDNTISKTNLPKTGIDNYFIILIISSIILMIIFGINIRRYKDIN